MATMKHLLWAWLGLLSLILVAQPAIGQSRTYYTANDQTTALMSPGTINFPDGNVHIRGAVVQTRVTSSLFSGNMIVTLNANWNSKFCGPIWGTFVLTLDNGGVWEGTWAGKRALAAGGWSASLVAEGYGIAHSRMISHPAVIRNTSLLIREANFCDFRSVHLVSGLWGSSETGGNWRDLIDSGYPLAQEGFAR